MPQLSRAKHCFLVHLKEWQMAASCISPTPQQSPWEVAASVGSQFWEPSFTFGGQKSMVAICYLLIWQEIVSFCRCNKKTCSPASRHTPALHVLLFSNYIQILQLLSWYFPRIKSIFSITFCNFFFIFRAYLYTTTPSPPHSLNFLKKSIFFT